MPAGLYPISGILYNIDGTTAVASATVKIRNENINKTLTETTNSSGQYVFDCGNFKGGWTDGDKITLYVIYQNYDAAITVTIDLTNHPAGREQDLTLIAVVESALRYFTVQEFLDYFQVSAYDDDNANGIKPQTIVKVGQMVEARIDNLTYRKWDDNAGNYYSYTDEYHTAKSMQTVFWLKNTPVNSISRFEVNITATSQKEEWKNIMYLLLDACDATTDWAATTDGAITLNTTNNQVNEGTGALNITKTGGTVNNVTFSKTLSSTFDFTRSDFKLDFYCEDITELVATGSTAVEIRIGSNASNYYSFVFDRTKIGQAAWSTLAIKFDSDDSNASTTGSPDATACDYVAIKITYAASGTTVTVGDMRLDYIRFNNQEDLNIKLESGRVEITNASDFFPEPGKDQVRSTYLQGSSSVDEDIKLLAILMTGKSFAKRTLQRLNISANEVEGLSSAIQNLTVDDEEIKSILKTKSFPPIGNMWKEQAEYY